MKRVNIQSVQPDAYQAMFGLEKYLETIDLPNDLVELIRTRASQINGCAFCIQMHTQSALKTGETSERLFALSAWEESSMFKDSERSALALTEEVTLISEHGVSDKVYSELQNHFGEEQIAQLIMAIAIINAWNRIAVSTHAQ